MAGALRLFVSFLRKKNSIQIEKLCEETFLHLDGVLKTLLELLISVLASCDTKSAQFKFAFQCTTAGSMNKFCIAVNLSKCSDLAQALLRAPNKGQVS